MSVRRILIYLICAMIAGGLLSVALPSLGIPRSHFLPPPQVYATAQGHTQGVITQKYTHESGNPFRVGVLVYFLDFQFRAPAPMTLGVPRPGAVQRYGGIVRVDEGIWGAARIGQTIPVKYETTYPYINGIDSPQIGRSQSEGSNILSGWILWLVLTFALGYALMMFADRILPRENI